MGAKSTSTAPPKIAQLSVQSSSLGLPITLGWGRGRIKGNIIWYNAFKAATVKTKQAGGKGMGAPKSISYKYSASVIIGLCEGQIQGIRTVFRDKDVFVDNVVSYSWDGIDYGSTSESALQQVGLSLATGTLSQSPWGYVTSLYADQALGYSGIAYVYAQDYPLTDNAALSNHSFEVDFAVQISGLADADPAAIVTDFLTNSAHGVPGWASGLLGDLTDWSDYCRANNLLLSPVLEEQRTASDCITEWTEATNSAAFWSEGVLKVATFGDAAATGNGVTWTPDLAPQYDLTEDDFLPTDGAPVQLEIVDQADAYNVVQVEFLDRANQYNVAIATADDNANITAFGERKKDPTQFHCIADAAMARVSAQLLLQRTLYRRDLYRFRLPWNFIRLEPMDYVTLTTTTDELQLYRQLVQIVDIEEDEEGMLSFSAEGLDVGAASSALHDAHSGSAVTVDTSVLPGSIANPVLINAPASLTGLDPEVWCAVAAPSAAWGGCEVWASANGVDYQRVGIIDGPARVGHATADLADHADPDSLNTLSVDLSSGKQTLDSASAASADAGATLIYLGGELMAYETATMTADFHYDLTGLRRGLYGTAHAAHGAGAPFARLDDAIFKFPYTALNVGSTIYLQFLSFNVFGQALQSPADTFEYSMSLLAPGDATDWRDVATSAEDDAEEALAELADIASDGLLTPDEKPRVIYDRDVIVNEQSGIDAQATAFGVTTEKAAYDTAVTALTTYLATLTSAVLWSNLTGSTTIVGTTFRGKFADVYAARQVLLNKIAEIAATRATWGSVSSRPTELTDGRIAAGLNSDGTVKATRVSTPSLIDNSVSKTAEVSMVGTLTGDAGFTWQDACNYTAILDYDGAIHFAADIQQSYSSGTLPQAWEIRILVDGTAVKVKGGAGWGTDSGSIAGAVDVVAGSHPIKLQWRGDNVNLQLASASMSILSRMK